MLLKEAGFDLVFSDVNAELIDSINNHDEYTVHEVGKSPKEITIDGFSGINSAQNPEELTAAIAEATVVTTAVGPSILKFIAPSIAEGLKRRAELGSTRPLAIMACENAINATDTLADAIREIYPEADQHAAFANTAVDRIVPNQAQGQGLDVTVENYYEWAIEKGPLKDLDINIPGATWVEDLAPYISRKLFTVNTGHATLAYWGYLKGITKISDAMQDPEIRGRVEAVLAETKDLVVRKFGLSEQDQQAYVDKILTRFENPSLPDTTERVGRAPLRKVSRNERFIGPAAALAEMGRDADALLETVGALLKFDSSADPEAVELQERLQAVRDGSANVQDTVKELTGIDSTHPLYEKLERVFKDAL